MTPKYFVTPSDIIIDSVDDIRKAAYATVADRYHGKDMKMDDSDEQFLAGIEEACNKLRTEVERWTMRNCCCCTPNLSLAQRQVDVDYAKAINGIKNFPPYLDNPKGGDI